MLNSLLVTKPQKLNCVKEMNEVVCEFRLFFEKALESVNHDEHTKIFRERIERAFTKFDWHGNVGTAASDFQKHSDNAKALISSVLKLLGMKGCGILIIETYLKLCIKIVKEMLDNENTNQTTDKSNFKLLLDGVFTTSTMLKKYWHIALLPNHKNSVSLCLSQICKGLPFLLNMIEVKNSDIKKFALKMLEQCFNKMLDNIHCDGNLQVKDCGQEFITLMDYCLNKLNGLANDTTDFSSFIQKAESTVPNLKPMIDEILCYAMSVLQVTESENDHAAITSSSLKVCNFIKFTFVQPNHKIFMIYFQFF